MHSRCQKGMSGAKRWLIAQLISMYRAFAISIIMNISHSDACAAIMVKPAYSPAEALHKKLVTMPCITLSPEFLAAMPSENDTAK